MDEPSRENACSVGPLFETFEEFPTPQSTVIEGSVPDWLSGTLVRVGPGKFEFGEDQYQHWFDGMAIVHKFVISNGEITFQSRFVNSDAYMENKDKQRITISEFGTVSTPDPCSSKFARFKARFSKTTLSDNVNVNVFKRGDAVLVNSDSPIFQVLDENLERVDKANMDHSISLTLCSSHPHFDDDGTMYISGNSFKTSTGPQYHIVKLPPPPTDTLYADELMGGSQVIGTISAKSPMNPTYCHSFGMTENYFIYCETPVTMNVFKALTNGFRRRPLNDVFSYNPEAMATFHVLSKTTGEAYPVKFQSKGFFFWHIINCYEEGKHIVMDICMLANFRDSDLFSEPLEEFRNGRFIDESQWAEYTHHPVRLVLPIDLSAHRNTGPGVNLVKLANTNCKAFNVAKDLISLEHERLLPPGQDRIDMPVINYAKVNSKPYQYFYGAGLFVNQFFMNGLGKVDVQNKTCLRWRGTVDQYPSEPVFVPHPDGVDEDDGLILSSVCDVNPSERDFMLILCAKTFKEIGRAYTKPGVGIPYSFHGSFYS